MTNSIAEIVPKRISPAELQSRISQSSVRHEASDVAFADVLGEKIGDLRFSQHALHRLRSRAIELSEEDRHNLTHAVELASAKGAEESLILIEDLSLIVNIRNRVVITAMERGETNANIFTHIDSAVVLPRARR